MRIRILQHPTIHCVDGVELDAFQVGAEYDLGSSLASFLIAEGWAEPIAPDAPHDSTPFGPDDPFDSRVLYPARDTPANVTKERMPPYLDRDLAADVPWRLRGRRSRGSDNSG